MDSKGQLGIDDVPIGSSIPIMSASNPALKNGGDKAGAEAMCCYAILDDLSSEDNLVPALSDQENAGRLRNSRYVYIEDGTTDYFGQIVKGPIYTPEWGAVRDGTNTFPIVNGDKVDYVPSYHGFIQVKILGEIENMGERKVLQKTFHRPHPKAKMRYVPESELLPLLKLPADTESLMGVLANYSNRDSKDAVRFCIEDKLIRKQLGIFGATGQGKSNTVLSLAEALAEKDWCVIILDHSGEYTECNDASEETTLFSNFWRGLGVIPKGIPKFVRLVPVTDRAAPKGALKFSVKSKAVSFSVLKSLLNLTPTQDEKLDAFRRELADQYDGLQSLKDRAEQLGNSDPSRGPLLRKIDKLINLGGGGDKNGWKYRLFDNAVTPEYDVSHPDILGKDSGNSINQQVLYLTRSELIKRGTVIVVDFGNTSNQDIINIIALDILKKLEQAKASVQRAERTKVAIFMEEAHTFFSAEYTGNDQIARGLTSTVKKIFKIGRKFYLNPVVISQQPSDVPGSILSQCTTKIIHQLSDEEDIRKVTKGSARLYQNTIPDLRTGEALVTNSEFTTAQIIRLRPAKAKKIDPYLTKVIAEENASDIDAADTDYEPDED